MSRAADQGRAYPFTLAEATINLEIVKDTAASTLETTRPEIVAPAQGAVVWGKFVVGLSDSIFPRLNSTGARATATRRSRNRGSECSRQQPGPHLRYAFTVDAKTLVPGPNELAAVFKEAPGSEIVSDPLDIVVHEPNPTAITAEIAKTRPPRIGLDLKYRSRMPRRVRSAKAPSVIPDDNRLSVPS